MQSRQVFGRNRVIFYHRSERSNWAIKMVLRTTFHKVSSHQTRDLECFADSSSIPWNPPTIFRPDLIATVPRMSLPQFCALSAIPFVSDRWGVDVQWFHDKSSEDFQNSSELSVWMTVGFLVGSKNFCKLFSVSWEVFVLHGYDCIHCVAKSCTTTAHRWLCRDSHPSLRTLWSAVTKSPKKISSGHDRTSASSARGPCNFGSQALLARGSESNSWEEVEAFRCSGKLSSTRLCLNSCSHSGRSCDEFPRTASLPSFLFGFRFLLVYATSFLVLPYSYSNFLLMRDALLPAILVLEM